jgi:cytochrome c-type biogenesis protein CcmF
VISEAVTNEKISVGPPFFNKINVPIGLLLLFLTGVGPLFAWRRTSIESLRRNFQWPALVSLVFAAGLVAAGMRHFYAIVCFALCMFVALTIITEFFKGSRLIQRKLNVNPFSAVIELTHRNTRRYGGYLVHMAIVLIFIGFAGAAFNIEGQGEVPVGDALKVGNYEFHIKQMIEDNNPNYASQTAEVELRRDGEVLEVMMPERRAYHASGQGTSEVAIRASMSEDVYIVFAGYSNTGENPMLQVYINPLVNWIWVGAFLLVFGTLVALVPSKIKPIRTRIIGKMKKEHAVLAKT